MREHDITTGPVEERGFGLVHARTVLTHLRERHRAIENLISCTRPGGWVVLEDPDMATMGRSYPEEELNERFCRTLEGLITAGGGDPHFGMRLSEALFAAGLENVGFRVRMPHGTGQTGLDHLEGIADRLIANAIFTPDEIRRLTLFLQDDRVVRHGPVIIAAWGRIPEPTRASQTAELDGLQPEIPARTNDGATEVISRSALLFD
jgi:hypothetical protein